jgi:hypothetical protein
VIDHLMSEHQVRVIQSFSDANSVAHQAGESGVIRQMGLDWPQKQLWIEWERNGAREKMVFHLDARQGPRSGAMREFFELGDFVPTPRPAPPPPRPPSPRDVNERLISDETQYEAAVRRVWLGAADRRFDEAKSQIFEINGWLTVNWRIKEMAQHLTAMAAAHVEDTDPTVYVWVKDWATQVWYMWGSGATSGGEGAAFAREIEAGEKILAELDKRRERAGLQLGQPPA